MGKRRRDGPHPRKRERKRKEEELAEKKTSLSDKAASTNESAPGELIYESNPKHSEP